MEPYEQMQEWSAPGVLGFYHSCEVTLCGLLDHDGTVYNLYTLVVFEGQALPEEAGGSYLTRRNERFGPGFRLIVAQYRISLEQALELCRQLQSGAEQVQTPLGALTLSEERSAMPPTFVPIDSTRTIPLYRVLKNNFCGGSMVVEWFGANEPIQARLGEKELRRLTLRIRELLPLDLFSLCDRIGNVVFQLPEQIAFCTLSGSEHTTTCTVVFDERVTDPGKYWVSAMSEIDHTLVGAQIAGGAGKRAWTLTLGETGGPYVITVLDPEHHIPILQQTTSMIRVASNVLVWRGNADCVRTISVGGRTERVIVHSAQRNTVGRPEYPWKAAIQQRRYQKRMEELTRSREFVRYGKGSNDREQGLRDLRELMNASVGTRVCLWDPYLSAQDLLETWYFTDTFGLELRAITSGEPARRRDLSLAEWCEEERRCLAEGSNQYGVNLQWRVQHDTFGFPFHDRFLIRLTPDGERPRVWSLGTSVNSFGKKHHILQQVPNPGYIADDFEDLWAALEDPACQIWNSEERKRRGRPLEKT